MSKITIENNSNLSDGEAVGMCADLFLGHQTLSDGLIESPCGATIKYSRGMSGSHIFKVMQDD